MMEAQNKIFNYFMKTSNDLEEKALKKEIELEDYLFVKGVLVGLVKAYGWSFGEDDKYKDMLDEMD